MFKKTLVVNVEHGIHARPAARITKVCRDLDSRVTFAKGDKTADGKSILQMLLLAAEQGAMVDVTIEGGDESAAMDKIQEVFENGAGI